MARCPLFFKRLVFAGSYLALGLFLFLYAWLARYPNPGVGVRVLLSPDGTPLLDENGAPLRELVKFSAIYNFTYNLVSNLAMVGGAVCIFLFSLKLVRLRTHRCK